MNVRDLPSHASTRLITDPTAARVPTQFRSTDATTALTRGVAEYAASLRLPGGEPAFVVAFDAWAEPEDVADYPGFVAYTNDNEGEYEAANLSPFVSQTRYADGTYETSTSDLVVDIKCEAWSTNPEMRQVLVNLLEQAFAPVDWMMGFRLELPHYFGQHATYEPRRIIYKGGAIEARQRYVVARMVVRGHVPVTRLLPFAQGTPETRVTVQAGPLAPPPGVIKS